MGMNRNKIPKPPRPASFAQPPKGTSKHEKYIKGQMSGHYDPRIEAKRGMYDMWNNAQKQKEELDMSKLKFPPAKFVMDPKFTRNWLRENITEYIWSIQRLE